MAFEKKNLVNDTTQIQRITLGESVTVGDGKDRLETPLTALAHQYNIGTSFIGAGDEYLEIPDSALKLVLAAIGVDTSTPDRINEALSEARLNKWNQPLKGTVTEIEGYGSTVDLYIPEGTLESFEFLIKLEDGNVMKIDITNISEASERQQVNRYGTANKPVLVEHRQFSLPTSVPTGYHQFQLKHNDAVFFSSFLIVTPALAPIPSKRMTGFMSHFYSQRSKDSWGIGDFIDLQYIAKTSRQKAKADFLLINPTHADSPSLPQIPSPYLPTSRQQINPIYIRPEAIFEYKNLNHLDKNTVDDIIRMAKGLNSEVNIINRDAIWTLKKQALKVIFSAGIAAPERNHDFEQYKAKRGEALTRFAMWCVMCDKFGSNGDWLQDTTPKSSIVKETSINNAVDIEFYRWLQWIANEQFQRAHLDMLHSGASIGLMADLAVGANPRGADVWAYPDDFVHGVSVGAPPDVYNQLGQNWSQLPLDPFQLEKTGYKHYKNIVQGIFRNAGAVRIDHMLGLFRLWWVPKGSSPANGAYMHYNHDAMIGILCLEAQRAGAYVIGEDLGVVPSGTHKYLKSRGILGTSVLWFERLKNGKHRPVEDLRELILATVTTHDLPPTLGYLHGEHVQLRNSLGLLSDSYETVKKAQEKDRDITIEYLIRHGSLKKDQRNDDEAIVIAMYKAILDAPSLLVGVAFTDTVGEVRTQNQPGTSDEYPNWRVPLADNRGNQVLNEDLFTHPKFVRFVKEVLNIDVTANNEASNLPINQPIPPENLRNDTYTGN